MAFCICGSFILETRFVETLKDYFAYCTRHNNASLQRSECSFFFKGQFPIPSGDGGKKSALPKLNKCPNKISLEMSLGQNTLHQTFIFGQMCHVLANSCHQQLIQATIKSSMVAAYGASIIRLPGVDQLFTVPVPTILQINFWIQEAGTAQ